MATRPMFAKLVKFDAEGNVFVAGRFNGPTPFYGCGVTNLKPGLTNGYAMQTMRGEGYYWLGLPPRCRRLSINR